MQGLPGGFVAVAYHTHGSSTQNAQLVIVKADMSSAEPATQENNNSRIVPGGVTKVNALVLLPDGRLAGARSDGEVIIWNFSGRKKVGEVELTVEDEQPPSDFSVFGNLPPKIRQ